MVDWRSSMQQTFEYFIVDPGTWKDSKPLKTVKSCTITRDSGIETLGSAIIDVSEPIDECYVRIYLVTIQNGVRERHPLGAYLVQTPSTNFNGKVDSISLDAYTPLLELKENQPPIGYYIAKGENIMEHAYRLVREYSRAPVVKPVSSSTLNYDFVADPADTWLSYLNSLIANANYTFGLDEMGRILFSPIQDTASLQPVWTYDDGDTSILYPDLEIDRDLYGIPNVVEVIYSTAGEQYFKRVINDDPGSPVSTVNRGREIVYRVTDPDVIGIPTIHQLDEYAEQLLRNLSSLEHTITYTHGYCPVRLGDCVRHIYTRAGLNDTKAKVVSQSISCEPGCPVSETAVFTTKLWR